MYKTKRFLTVLAALFILTAGAWAAEATVYTSEVAMSALQEGDILCEGATINQDVTGSVMFAANRWKYAGEVKTTGGYFNKTPYTILTGGAIAWSDNYATPVTESGSDGNAWEVTKVESSGGYTSVYIGGITYTAPAGTVTLNSTQTEATLTMPAENVTMTYELVRDLTVSVTFRGVPTDGKPLTVMPAAGGKYAFADPEPAFTLHDDIEQADITDGITIVAQQKGDNDEYGAPVTLDAFRADPQPGTWRLQAYANADGPYDGFIQSPEFQIASVAIYAVNATGDTDGAEGASVTATADGQPVTVGQTLHDAAKGKTVNVTITPRPGYRVKSVKAVKGAGGKAAASTPDISQADCTFSPSNGKSTLSNANITTSMEYSIDGGTTWTDVTSNGSIASLAAGTVQIRFKETDENLASEAVSITVPEVLHTNELVGPYTGNRLTCEYYAGETWQDLVSRYDLIQVYSGYAAFGSDGFIYDAEWQKVPAAEQIDSNMTYKVE